MTRQVRLSGKLWTEMPRFRVRHNSSCEEWEVEAPDQDVARQVVGWPGEVCQIFMLGRGPFAEIKPPKVAVQVSPPLEGSVHVCPDCIVTMVEKTGEDFWWQCPACDQLYHEWDNAIYRSGDV
jgi:hypothetical protein